MNGGWGSIPPFAVVVLFPFFPIFVFVVPVIFVDVVDDFVFGFFEDGVYGVGELELWEEFWRYVKNLDMRGKSAYHAYKVLLGG